MARPMQDRQPRTRLSLSKNEFGAKANSETSGRTLLAGSSPDYLWASMAQIFGLPAVPECATWFYQKLDGNLAISRIYGLGCCPVLVTGTKEEFLRWLSEGIRKGEIQLPERNGPAVWPSTPLERILLPEANVLDEESPISQ